jgi:hypothetical protein
LFGKPSRQPLASSREPLAECGVRDSENHRSLTQLETLDPYQQQELAIAVGERCQCGLEPIDPGRLIDGLDRFRPGLLLAPELEKSAEIDDLRAAMAPELVPRHGKQPGTDVGVLTQSRGTLRELQPGVLKQIGRDLLVLAQAQQKSVQAPAFGRIDAFESFTASTAHCGDDGGFHG